MDSKQDAKFQRSPSEKLELDSIAVDVHHPRSPVASCAAPKMSPPAPRARLPSMKKSQGREPHWSTTPDGALLSRATACVYKKIISPAKDGGLKDFLEEHCGKFVSLDEGEFGLEHMQLYQHYESEIEKMLESFAAEEGMSVQEVVSKVQVAAESSKGAEKNLTILLAASNFSKFVRFMRTKAESAMEKDAAEDKGELKNGSK